MPENAHPDPSVPLPPAPAQAAVPPPTVPFPTAPLPTVPPPTVPTVPPPGWPLLEGWRAVVRRIRVPLGFLTAILFLIFARPTWASLATSLVLVIPGIWLRSYAAGYVKKNAELTRTGPYAHTRNPLYLGSLLITLGFALAAAKLWLAILVVALFLLIYVPTILSEEVFLRRTFVGFDAYAAAVPRLLPRLTPARFPDIAGARGKFARERYLHHREYNSLMGAGVVYALLVARMLLHGRGGV